ncbi:MAG: hypothetical protein ACTS27_06120 [Phycisphaerales bacterium]
MATRTTVWSGVAALAMGATATAGMDMGNPILEIGGGTGMTFAQAMQNGLIRPWDPATVSGIAQQFYQTQGPTAFVASSLTPDLAVDLNGQTHEGSLVMQWNPLMQGEDLAVAAFDLDLRGMGRGGNPGIDLRGGSVHFWVGAPTGVWDLSVELLDANGNWRGWFLSMPPTGWSEQWINFDELDQNGWGFYEDDGFDLWSVVGIRFDEAGSTSMTFPVPPDGSQPGFWDWNAFNHITLVPTPGAAAVLMLAGGVVARRRR